jgi:hypothetical protein
MGRFKSWSKVSSILLGRNYNPRDAEEKLDEVLNYLGKRLVICGLNVLSPTFKFTLTSYMVIFLAIFFFLENCYTVFYNRHNWDELIKCIVPIDCAVQSLVKLQICFLPNTTYFGETTYFLKDFHLKWAKKSPNNQKLSLASDRCLLVLYVLTISYNLVLVVNISYSVLSYLIFNEKVHGYVLYLPMVDPFDSWGFFVTALNQFLTTFIGVTSFIGIDGTFAVIMIYYTGLVDTFVNEIEDLDEKLDEDEIKIEDVGAKLKNLVVMQDEISVYNLVK